MSQPSDFPTRIRDVLQGMSTSLGMDHPLEVARLWREWESLVGGDIARHAHPSSLKRGVLRIRADSTVWATELGYLSEHIRTEANRLLGSEMIRSVKIWTGPDPASSGREPKARAAAPPVHPARVEASSSKEPAEALEGARRAWSRRSRGSRA